VRLIGAELTLHKLEIFCTVARMEGVTRAAEALHLAQPVVTAHIRSLEQKLGVKLFTRQGRRIRISDEGSRVLAWAEDIISRTQELERVLADSRRGQKGTAIIATSMTIGSYVLPEKIVAFRRDVPDGLISVFTASPREMIDAIQDGRADFGVTILDPQQDVSELDLEPVGEDELVLTSRVGGRFDTGRIALKDLEHLPFVSAQANSTRRAVEDAALFEAGIVRRNVILEFGHGEAIMRAVRADVGVALLFKSSIREELENGSLRILPMPDLNISVPIYLVRRSRKFFSTFQSRLYDFLRASFRQAEQGGRVDAA
jgi:DNA-binding transcriptional LysR family regulator